MMSTMALRQSIRTVLRTTTVPTAGPRVAPLGQLYRRSLSTDSRNPILLDIEGPKATITLNNAKISNALDVDLQNILIDHMKQLQKNDAVRAIVLTGVGKYFCTGMNLGDKGESLSGNNAEQHDRLKVMFEVISQSEKPVIAVINGPCYGGGNGLAMVCDIRIASSPDVTFTLSEVKLGVAPSLISKYLVREWGPAKAREAMITARPMTCTELLPVGGVHHIAENHEAAMKYADDVVKRMVGNAPGAMHTVKQLTLTMVNGSEAEKDGLIREKFLEMMEPSAEADYGIQMFRKKQKPDWSSLNKK